MINSSNYADMTDALRIQWLDAFNSQSGLDVVKQLYKVEDADGLTGYISSLDGFSTARRKDEGDDLPYLSLNQNYRKTWTTYTVGGMEKITWEMRKGDRYTEITDRIRGMARSAARKMEFDLTHRLTYVTATSYADRDGSTVTTTTGDGLALGSASHTVPGSSTTYRNIVSGNPVLSKTGLEAAENLFMTQMLDDNGEIQPVTPTHLVVGYDPNTINTALEYLKSTASPTVANSGVINVYQGKYQLVTLRFLATVGSTYAADSTKAKYWFLADLTNKRGVLKVLQEPTMIAPNDNNGMDFETMDWKYGNFAAYAIEWLDGKNLTFSAGDGS